MCKPGALPIFSACFRFIISKLEQSVVLFLYNIVYLRMSDGETGIGLHCVTLEPSWLSLFFSFSDLRAANVYHLLKRSINASINPEDSTFPGK